MLERYFEINSGIVKPRFQLARCQPTKVRQSDLISAEIGDLWAAHDEALANLKAGLKLVRDDAVDLLILKAAIARRLLSSCCFCERRCGVDRLAGKTGFCGVPAESRYASEFFHFGEEEELVPSHTVFFTGCNFRCVYCQNWDIATRPASGIPADPAGLARIIDRGRARGSRNVNFVGGNPDPHLHTCLQIISRLESDVPVVWNSNAYASVETMRLLDGVVDVFLSDFRYGNDSCARRYSKVGVYWKTVTRNLLLARSQAELMVRHLVLPGHLDCCSVPIMKWLNENLSGTYFNLMFQYHPEYLAFRYPEMDSAEPPGEGGSAGSGKQIRAVSRLRPISRLRNKAVPGPPDTSYI